MSQKKEEWQTIFDRHSAQLQDQIKDLTISNDAYLSENARLNQECETQLNELHSMAEEVRKVTLQREAYEQRIAEVKD